MVCKKCGGHGFIQEDSGHMGIPQAIPCECRVEKLINAQAEKAWTGLSKLAVKKKSPLTDWVEKDAIVLADKSSLATHLRSALHTYRSPYTFVKVVSDATLMSAWLSTLTMSDSEIYDPDFRRDVRASSLEDLAEAPDLLIIRVGIKSARNSAMPEVLTEAIELRQHLGKPTWVVTDPDRPLEEGHISWSRSVEDSLDGWDKVAVLETVSKKKMTAKPKVNKSGRNGRFAL